MALGHATINQSGYKYYVIDPEGRGILSGWDYKEDANDNKAEWQETGKRGFKVLTRRGLRKYNLDPDNDAHWRQDRQGWEGQRTQGVGGTQVSMTYGTIPEQTTFRNHYMQHVGRGKYEMELVGEDLEAMKDAYGEPMRWTPLGKGFYEFDWENLYMVIQSLMEEGEQRYTRIARLAEQQGGAGVEDNEYVEAPSSLASAIMGTLGFEWV